MSLLDSTATELLQLLRSGEATSQELTAGYLSRIAERDPSINAFLSATRDTALAQAEEIDRRRAAGEPLGKLAGLPIAIKDVLCVAGQATTCGSRMLEGFIPPYDATVVRLLREADAVLLGKTNMDEFAMGSSTENSAFFPTRNPWDRSRAPGGSSGGAAACVAAGMTPWSIGTDTGGSIRQPAAFCGVVGLKPSYGRVSRYGLVAFASSLDQVGPLTRTVGDAALLLEVIAAHDPADSTSAPQPTPAFSESVARPLAGLRIGIVRDHLEAGIDDEVRAAMQEAITAFQEVGATVHDVALPHGKYAIAVYYIISASEASSNLARYDGAHYGYRTDESRLNTELNDERERLAELKDQTSLDQLDSPLVRMYRQSRTEALGAEVKRRIMLGTYALSAGYKDAYYMKALKVRRLIRQDFDAAFREVDVILGPTTPEPAFELGAKLDEPLAMYLQDLYTVSANLCGITGVSLPCGFTRSGLPIGLQLQAPPFHEERLLRAANMFQQATDWHLRRPA